jgi:putative DNA primase/helicase
MSQIVESIEQAQVLQFPANAGMRNDSAAARGHIPHDGIDEDANESGPSGGDDGNIPPRVIQFCAGLDHSDTDNGKRLLAHFGDDLRVLKEAGAKTPSYVAWRGKYWDTDNGNLYAHAVAQKVGDRIGLEADFLTMTPREKQICEEAYSASDELSALEKSMPEWTDEQKAKARRLRVTVEAGEAVRAALQKRKIARRKFGVSSKNSARISSMLICAGPHCAVDPDDFNPDPFVFAVREHTLRLVRERDDECPDPDAVRMKAHVEAKEGHRREDMLTKFLDLTYQPEAGCPRWRAFLDECLPDASVRAFVQVFSGLGLLGVTVQKVVFHYGSGANGKSVFLETLMRVLGPLATGLPAESITGEGNRSAGGASPDLARLYGVRCLRVLELPADKPLHEDLVKKLTGGEKIPVRTLFKGYFEFAPFFTCHMSGNGYPRIDGTDNGIWRRMAVVHWPVEIPPERQRPFDEMIAYFAGEYSGILNWLIEGALKFCETGLPSPEGVIAATADYRSEMDPVSDFMRDCLEPAEGHHETARAVYDAYVSWSLANARRPIHETRFGRVMKTKLKRTDERVRRYLDCRLHDVPARPDVPRNPD